MHSPAHERAHYGGLQTCGLLWVDPVCSVKIGERRRAELEPAIAGWCDQGGAAFLQSMTVAHKGGIPLGELLPDMLEAYRRVEMQRAFKSLRKQSGVVGYVRGLECTWSETDGQHPHLHLIGCLDRSPERFDKDGYQEQVYGLFVAELGRVGLWCSPERGVDVRMTRGGLGDYLTKSGRLPKSGRSWGPVDELVKSTSKRGRKRDGDEHLSPFELLGRIRDTGALVTGEAEYIRPFREYWRCFKGKSQLRWTKGLRRLLGLGEREASDDELAAEEREVGDVLLAELDVEQWAAVLEYDARAELLGIADAGDAGAVRGFVAELVGRLRSARGEFRVAV